MSNGMTVILMILLIAAVVLLSLVLVKLFSDSRRTDPELREELLRLEEKVSGSMKANAEYNSRLRSELAESLREGAKTQEQQMVRLYRSLGELQNLSTGIEDLNRTMANVKTRGIWGEVQLKRILDEIMTSGQYDENVATKKNSQDRVEFAVRFPAQDGSGDIVYLPIDAKFPADLYNRIAEAEERGDPKGIAEASEALRQRILNEAKTIKAKYLDPPRTTDYAILYLPTEGLYAETLRIDGLFDKCRGIGILIAGPTTVTAILNGLQAGFRNIAISQKSREVMQLLSAVKAQTGRLYEETERAEKKLIEAGNAVEQLKKRTELLQRRLQKVEETEWD